MNLIVFSLSLSFDNTENCLYFVEIIIWFICSKVVLAVGDIGSISNRVFFLN